MRLGELKDSLELNTSSSRKKKKKGKKHTISTTSEEMCFRKEIIKPLVGIVWPLVDSNSHCHIELVAFA